MGPRRKKTYTRTMQYRELRKAHEDAPLQYSLEQLREWRDGCRWDGCSVGIAAAFITDLIDAHERIAELEEQLSEIATSDG